MNWCDVAGKGPEDRVKLNNFKIASLNLGVLCFSICTLHLRHMIFCSRDISILYSILVML